MSAYDQWLERGATRDDMWECTGCETENNGGDECDECGTFRPEAVCTTGRCGYCERCERAADEIADREWDISEQDSRNDGQADPSGGDN